ncbi:hypothetical protein CEXT_384471 [Caerostris extrusa]|uniref:DM14 domain-containing protein n=1 Tax=Caerostris extrusa TaxID=172846 RepID=A0AAV4Q042_CAEEX|nr:hypothetical protein CEXT_384471 [Caerostris extrusa]
MTDPILILLQERLSMYREAIEAAKINEDFSKVRRFGRALKTIENLLKSANSGILIKEDDIPPLVKIPKIKSSDKFNCDSMVLDMKQKFCST